MTSHYSRALEESVHPLRVAGMERRVQEPGKTNLLGGTQVPFLLRGEVTL
jgi:hypothetical protein